MAVTTLTTQQKLVEAEAAYHSLMTGTQPRVVVDQNGERVEYTVASAARLLAYIERLRSELYSTSSSGPLGAFF